MKRFAGFLLSTMLVLALAPVRGDATELRLGILGGGNSTVYAGDTPPKSSFKSQRAHQIGGVVDVVLSPSVVLSAQALVMSKTPVIETKIEDDPEVKETTEINTEYFTVPVMVQYVFGEKTTRFYLTAGGEVSWLQSATLKPPEMPEEDIKDKMNSMDVTVNVGAGVRSKLGPLRWFVELRYSYGLVDLAENTIVQGVDLVVWKSRSSQLFIGLTIPVLGS